MANNNMPLPPPGDQPDWEGGYRQIYPAVGLGSLMQGLAQGLTVGSELNMKGRQQDIEGQRFANESTYKDALLGQNATFHKALADAAQQNADTRQQLADEKNKKFTPAGQPIMSNGALIGFTDGHGGMQQPKGNQSKNPDEVNSIESDLSRLQELKDQMKLQPDTASATIQGAILNSQSIFPSTLAGQYKATADRVAGSIDHHLQGRVNNYTIGTQRKALPGLFDTTGGKSETGHSWDDKFKAAKDLWDKNKNLPMLSESGTMVQVKAPDGKIRMVPQNQVSDAVSNGGTLVK